MSGTQSPFYQIQQTLRHLQELDSTLIRGYNISLDEAILLCCISQKNKCQGNIASETGVNAVKASRMLSRLESKKLIERSIGSHDRRQMVFSLSDSGKAILEAVTPIGTEFIQ